MSFEAALFAWATSTSKRIPMESACTCEIVQQPQGAWWCMVMMTTCIAQKLCVLNEQPFLGMSLLHNLQLQNPSCCAVKVVPISLLIVNTVITRPRPGKVPIMLIKQRTKNSSCCSTKHNNVRKPKIALCKKPSPSIPGCT